MKTKLFLGLAAVALATVSCTSDDVLENEIGTKRAIGFSSYVNGTRAAYAGGDATLSTMQGDEGFGVVGYHSNSIYLGAEATSASATAAIQQTWQTPSGGTAAWDYATASELKYWPATGTMDFYAYFPYASTTKVRIAGANGSSTTPLEITEWSDGQDVLVAKALTQSSADRTNLSFAHAFAKINAVTVIQDKDGAVKDYTITVSSVEFLNTETTGSIKVSETGAISYTSASSPAARKVTPQSAITVAKTTGAATETPSSLIASTNNAYIFPISNTVVGSETTITGTGKTIWDGQKTTIASGKTLADDAQVVMVLKAKVYNGSDYKVGSSSDDGVIYIPIYDATNLTSLVAGKRYTFNITMKNDVGYKENGDPIFGLKPIKFSVSVNDWDESNTTVNITL